MVLPLAAARAQTFPTAPLNLSGTSHAVLPAIAVGPAGEINVVWLDSGAIFYRRSPAGGGAFSGTMAVAKTDLPTQALQPQIAVNSAGAYVAWAGTNSSGGGDVFFSSLASGASNWSPPVNVSNSKGIASGSAPVPRIATDPNGGVDIVWGQSAAYFARSTDNGNSFAVTLLSSSPMASASPRMAINAQGTVYVVWENADPNFPSTNCPTITFARSIDSGDSGAHFGNYPVDDTLTVNQVSQSGCTFDVQIALGAKNTIHLLWANDHSNISSIRDLITTYQTDSGSGFAGFDKADQQGFQNLATTAAYTPQMAIDSSGNINVVWMGEVSQSDPRQLVNFSRSTDGGGQFTNLPPLTNAPASGARATGFPQIATETSGAIDIIWQQASATNPNNAYDIVIARSTDGATFKRFTLDNSPTVTGNTGQLAVDGSGNAYVVWLGNSGTSADILLSGDSKALTDPGFSLTISTAGQTVLAGATVAYNVTVNSTGGFNQGVTLSCSNPPAGAQCSFNPPTVTLAASAATSTLMVSVPATIAAGAYSVSVTGAGGGLAQAVSTQFVVGGLTASIAPASATISVGGSASFTVSLSSTNGFSGPVTLACAGVPSGVSCSFNSGSVAVPGSATLNVGVSVKPSASAAQRSPGASSNWRPEGIPATALWMLGIGLAILFVTLTDRKKNAGAPAETSPRAVLSYKAMPFARPLALMLLLIAAATALVSCGGSTNGGGGGGSITFPLTVRAQSNSATTNLQNISITVP